MDDLRFIQVNEPRDLRQSNQSVVRAHVMRAVHANRQEARKRLEQLKAKKVPLRMHGVNQSQQGQRSHQQLSCNTNRGYTTATMKPSRPFESFLTSASATFPRVTSLKHIEQLIQTC